MRLRDEVSLKRSNSQLPDLGIRTSLPNIIEKNLCFHTLENILGNSRNRPTLVHLLTYCSY